MSKQIFDIANKSGLLNESSEENKLVCINLFAKNIVDLCVSLIEKEYIKGDICERTNGIRIARDAIIKGISFTELTGETLND